MECRGKGASLFDVVVDGSKSSGREFEKRLSSRIGLIGGDRRTLRATVQPPGWQCTQECEELITVGQELFLRLGVAPCHKRYVCGLRLVRSWSRLEFPASIPILFETMPARCRRSPTHHVSSR